MNGDDEGEPQSQKKSSIFMYFLYGSIIGFILLLLFSTFFSDVSEITINTIVSQNIEENLDCKYKIFFDNETVQTIGENFTLRKYESKEFSHPMITKKKKTVIFAESYCDGEHHYEQSKAYIILEPIYNEISIDFEFLKNNTNITYEIQK